MALKTGLTLPPTGASGAPIYETGIFTGAPGTRGVSLVSPDWGDRTTWYQKAVKVIDETLNRMPMTNTFVSANNWWIEIDSLRLTYTYKQIPRRDGTFGAHADWRVSIKVNDVVAAATTYMVNYAEGRITFTDGSTIAAINGGASVKATYWHNNGVVNPSEWIVTPPAGKKYTIEHVEMQFSKSVTSLSGGAMFEVWAGASVATYGNFPAYLFEAGYGQLRAEYRTIRDFINAANQGQGVIEPCGGLTSPIIVMPFNYIQALTLDSALGMTFRIVLPSNIPFQNVELATSTFYLQQS